MSSNNILILSAGRGLSMDGTHKLTLRVPFEPTQTIKDRLQKQFPGTLNVVVGYRAAELISEWPNLNFVFNHRWFETTSATSAGIGLQAVPDVDSVIIMPSDLILSNEDASAILSGNGNVVVVADTENRSKVAVNLKITEGIISESYRGPKRNGDDLEAVGIVKLADSSSIKRVTERCLQNRSEFLVEAVLESKVQVSPLKISSGFHEVNSVEDYYELWKSSKC